MANEQRIRAAFQAVRRDMVSLNLDFQNRARYLEFLLSEQKVRLQEAERRLSQMERLAIRETITR
ncbi:hypothetical protein J4419_04075 [Candidatus Woesearchaeota archaeon]|nr:hypothetical protein [Candidatus Woesearchaeota archaeon]